MKIIVIILALFLVGCEVYSTKGKYSGTNSNLWENCINGVVYYEFMHAITPAFKTDGTLYLCDKR